MTESTHGTITPTTDSIATQKISPISIVAGKFFSNKKRLKTFYKAVSYRVLGSLATVIISYLLTSELTLSLSIGGFELVGKIILFYLHEVAWEKIW